MSKSIKSKQPTATKPTTKESVQLTELRRILFTPDDLDSIPLLVEKVKPADRSKLLEQLRGEFTSNSQALLLTNLEQILRLFGIGTASAGAVKLAVTGVSLAITAGTKGIDFVAGWALKTLRLQLGMHSEGYVLPEKAISELATRVELRPVLGRLLSQIVVVDDQRDKLLNLWTDLMAKVMADDSPSVENPWQINTAEEILQAIGKLPATQIPSRLFGGIPRIAGAVSDQGIRAFSETSAGQVAIAAYRLSVPGKPIPLKVPAGWRNRFLDRAGLVLDELVQELMEETLESSTTTPLVTEINSQTLNREENQTPEINNQLSAKITEEFRARIDNLERQLREAEVKAQTLEAESVIREKELEAATSLSRINELERLLGEAELKARTWEAEVARREKELEAANRLAQSKDRQETRKLLYTPTKDVVEHLENQLRIHSSDNGIRRLGLAFDSLQRNVMRVIGETTMSRIDKELLTPPSSESSTDGQFDSPRN